MHIEGQRGILCAHCLFDSIMTGEHDFPVLDIMPYEGKR